MTTLIITLVIVGAVLVAVFLLIRQRNRRATIARSDQLRAQAAAGAQSTLPGAQEGAAEAAAKAEEARTAAERAEAEAREAQIAASQVEATHEAQVRAADRLDPRVDHEAEDYAPQVAGTADQQPVAPADVTADVTTDVTAEPASESGEDPDRAPLLPRRTPGAQEMPGEPMKSEDGGGWFTRKDRGSPDQS